MMHGIDPKRSGSQPPSDPHRDDAGGERGEHRGPVADALLVEVQDDERRHRRVADDRQRRARDRAAAPRARSAAALGARRRRGGRTAPASATRSRRRAAARRRRTPRPSRSSSRWRIELAERRPEREPAPDREPVEADDPAAAVRRGHVDDPRRAGGVDGALAGAEEEPGHDQAGDAGGDEVEERRRPRSTARRAMTTILRPRWSASRPANGRQARPVIANAPVTIPTSSSPSRRAVR